LTGAAQADGMEVSLEYKMRIIISVVLLMSFANSLPAKAAVMFTFSGLQMSDGIAGDPILTASGNFTVSQLRSSPLSNSSSYDLTPTSVDIIISDGPSTIRSFVDPSYFLYADGIGADGNYYMDLENTQFLDLAFDQFGVTIVNGTAAGDFSTLSFASGFHSLDPVPAAEVTAVPEASTWAMLLIGFAGIGFMSYRRKQNGAALSAA
jgi:hypothetical protein